jgi:hypothetical protein
VDRDRIKLKRQWLERNMKRFHINSPPLLIVFFAFSVAVFGAGLPAAAEEAPSETVEIFRACRELPDRGGRRQWRRLLGLVHALRIAVETYNEDLADRLPYDSLPDVRDHLTLPMGPSELVLQDRRSVLRAPQLVQTRLLHRATVVVRGELVGPREIGYDHKSPWVGVIDQSIVLVDGPATIAGAVRDSVLIVNGPIIMKGLIRGSLIVSVPPIDSEEAPDEPKTEEPPPEKDVAPQPDPVDPFADASGPAPVAPSEWDKAKRTWPGDLLIQGGTIRDSIVLASIVNAKFTDNCFAFGGVRLESRGSVVGGCQIRNNGAQRRIPWEVRQPARFRARPKSNGR